MSKPPNTSESRSALGLYLGAVIILILLEVLAVLSIFFFRPEKDNTQLITTVTLLVVPTVTSLVNLINNHRTHAKVEEAQKQNAETQKMVNGRMDQQLRDSTEAAYRRGIAETEEKYRLLMTPPPAVAVPPNPVTPPKADG